MAEAAAERAIRLIDLVPYLVAHPGITVKEVAHEFDLTVPELTKDLDLLFMCGLPGYTPLELIDLSVDDGVISIRDPQNLDAPRRFSQTETLVIRVALSALEELLPEEKREKVRALQVKLNHFFRSDVPENALFYQGDASREKMQVIRKAIELDKKLRLRYLNLTKSEITERTVSVFRVVAEVQRTLIDAWCDLSDGVRTFNLAQIQGIELLDEQARAVLDSSEGASTPVLFKAEDRSYFLVENESAIIREDEGYRIDIFQEEWLVRSALSEAGAIVIEAPEIIRRRIAQRAREALKNY